MNKSFYNQDNIEAYLTGKLSGADNRTFEEGLSKDPLLQNEIGLQKEIIDALKESRRLELKRRLDSIQIIQETVNFSKWKIGASALALIAAFTGGYFWYSSPADAPERIHVIGSREEIVSNASPSVVLPGKAAVADNTPNNIQLPAPSLSERGKTKSNPGNESAAATSFTSPSDIVSPQVKENFGDDDVVIESNIIVPSGEITDSDVNHKSEVEVLIEPKGKNTFHYQFYSNKLYLYCDFNSQPYELLELNTKKSKQIFLHFNNSYYELRHNQVEMSELTPLRNQELIRQLDTIKYK